MLYAKRLNRLSNCARANTVVGPLLRVGGSDPHQRGTLKRKPTASVTEPGRAVSAQTGSQAVAGCVAGGLELRRMRIGPGSTSRASATPLDTPPG